MQSQRFIADKKSSFLTSVSHYEFQKKLGYQDDTGFKNYHGNILATAICDESHSIFIEFEHQLIILNKDLSERKKINLAPSEATLSLMSYNQGNDILFCKRGFLKSLNIETETWTKIYEYQPDNPHIKPPIILGCQNNIVLLAIHNLRGVLIKTVSIDSNHIESEWMLPLVLTHDIHLSQDKSLLIHSFESYSTNSFQINIYDIKNQFLMKSIKFEKLISYSKVKFSHDNSLLIINMNLTIVIYDIYKDCIQDKRFNGKNFSLTHDNKYLFIIHDQLSVFDLKNNTYIDTRIDLPASFHTNIYMNEEDRSLLILDKMNLHLLHYEGSRGPKMKSLYACLLFELAANNNNCSTFSLCPDIRNLIYLFIFKLNLVYGIPNDLILNLTNIFKDNFKDLIEKETKINNPGQLGIFAYQEYDDDIVSPAHTHDTSNNMKKRP